MAVQTWAQHKEASGMLWTQRSDTGPTPHHWIATFNASLKTHIGANRLPHSPDTSCPPHTLRQRTIKNQQGGESIGDDPNPECTKPCENPPPKGEFGGQRPNHCNENTGKKKTGGLIEPNPTYTCNRKKQLAPPLNTPTQNDTALQI